MAGAGFRRAASVMGREPRNTTGCTRHWRDNPPVTWCCSCSCSRGRGGTPYAHLMERAAAQLEPGDIRDLAAYYANLPPGQGDAIIDP